MVWQAEVVVLSNASGKDTSKSIVIGAIDVGAHTSRWIVVGIALFVAEVIKDVVFVGARIQFWHQVSMIVVVADDIVAAVGGI